jgi:hypothetical protein
MGLYSPLRIVEKYSQGSKGLPLPSPFKGRELKKSQKACKIGVGRRQ